MIDICETGFSASLLCFVACCRKRSTVLNVKGNMLLRENIVDVFGPKQV